MRFGVREICDVVFKARTDTKVGNKTFKKGQPVLYLDTAKTSTLEGAASTVYAQGGKGNPRLVAWEGERTVTFTVEDALISPISFALLTGAGLGNMADANSKQKIKVHTTFDLPILDGGVVKIDLDTAGDNHDIVIDDETPVFGMILDNAGAGVVPCQLATAGVTGIQPNNGVYTISRDTALELTFAGASGYVGKTMRVDCYTEKTGGATEITIDAENFAGNYYVEASTLFREQSTAKDMPAEIILPNVKIQSNFTFSMAASGDPSTFTFTMDAFPDYTKFDKQHKVFAAIQIIGEENIQEDVPDADATPSEETVVEIAEVIAGAQTWEDKQFPGDPKNIQFIALGNHLKSTIDGKMNVDFSGNLNRIDNWNAFSNIPEDLTGYYYPFTMVAPEGKTLTLTRTMRNGTVKTSQITDSGEDNFIWAIDPNAPVYMGVLSDGENETEWTFDFSKVIFK